MTDAFPSWNATTTRAAILDFAARVTSEQPWKAAYAKDHAWPGTTTTKHDERDDRATVFAEVS